MICFQLAPWRSDIRSTLTGLLLLLPLLLATAFPAAAAPAGALPAVDDVELDGDAIDDPIGAPDDWDTITSGSSGADIYTPVIPDPAGDNIFTTGGSKDHRDISDWRWTDGSVPAKDEILNAMAALYTGNNLYFAADRFANNGDASLGFWLFQNPVGLNPDGTFSGVHAVGDVLILADFVNGGATTIVPRVFVWVGDGSGSEGNIDEVFVGIDVATAFTNADVVCAPWPYEPKFPDACPPGCSDPNCFPPNSFFEGGLDLGALGVNPCFSSYLVETRSSQSVDAQLKDFVLGDFTTNPTCEILGEPKLCENEITEFCSDCDLSIGSYSWEVVSGDAVIIGATDGSCVSVQAGATDFQLKLSVVGDNTCVGETYYDVAVNTLPVCSIDGVDEACEGSSNEHCAGCGDGDFSYAWSIAGDGTITTPLDGDCVTVDAGDAGSYTLTLEVTSAAGCVDTFEKTVTVNPNPLVTVTDNEACDGFTADLCAEVSVGKWPFTFDWSGPDGFVSTDSCIVVGDAGTYSVTVTDANGCMGSGSGNLVINDNPVVTVADNEACDGFTADLCAEVSGGEWPFTFDWSGPDGFTSPDSCVTVGDAGTYSVTVTDANGCVGSNSGTLTIHDNPVVTVENGEACDGFTDDLCAEVSGGQWPFTFDWSGPGGFTSPDSCITVGDAGTYSVTVTDANGCEGSGSGNLVIHDNPVVTVADKEACEGFDTDLCAEVSGGQWPFTFDWSGPDGFTSPDSCITVGDAGTYTVTVTDANGCVGEDSGDLTINPGLVVKIDDQEACEGFTAELCAVINGGQGPFSFDWSGPGGFASTDSCITVDTAGTYTCAVEDVNGCEGDGSGVVTIHDNPVVTVDDNAACDGFTAELCAEVSGGQWPFTFDWSGPDGFTSPDSCITVGDAGTYTVTVTDANGCEGTDDGIMTVYDNPVCALEPPDQLPNCGSDGNTLSGPAGFVTYEWEIVSAPSGWLITDGASEQTVTYTAGDEGDATFKLTIVDGNGCMGMCTVTFTCTPVVTDKFCTFTQGFFGNEGGKFNGIPTLDLIKSLITPDDPLVVGVPGSLRSIEGLLGGAGRSVTWEGGASDGYIFDDCPEEPNGDPGVSEHCIIERLPAGGPASELPLGLGDATVDPSDCQTDPPLPTQNGKYRNVLLGQTIALSLNVRLDENLSDLEVCRFMETALANAGPDGCYGTEDDTIQHPGGDTTSVYIPMSVLDKLDADPSLDTTVGGILELANLGLAGLLDPVSDPGLSDVSDAAAAINELFDECRFLITCDDGGVIRTASSDNPTDGPGAFMLGRSYPNPARGVTTFHFVLPEPSRVRLAVYDVAGRQVELLLGGSLRSGYHTAVWNAVERANFAPGVYFYRMEAVGSVTGKKFSETQRMLVLK